MVNRLCAHARRQFSDLMDGQAVPLRSRVLARSHLTICPQCRRVQRSLASTKAALGALREVDPELEPDSGERPRE
jgi:predicted anti-sigma-YlaC factor YlaD